MPNMGYIIVYRWGRWAGGLEGSQLARIATPLLQMHRNHRDHPSEPTLNILVVKFESGKIKGTSYWFVQNLMLYAIKL